MNHRQLLGRAGALLCACALTLSIVPPVAKAAETSAPLTPAQSSNIHQNNYDQYSKPVNSYLYDRWGEGLTRVEYINGKVVIEEYDNDFRLLSTRTLTPELPLWGGFFSGENFNYLIYGQENPSHSSRVGVIRVVKYDKHWNRKGAVDFDEAPNITIPFAQGSLRCDEYGDYLFIRTSKLEQGSDGVEHQSNLTISLRQSDMEIMDHSNDVTGVDYGCVTSSLNQFILVDSRGKLIALDHGNADPRSAVLIGYNTEVYEGTFSDYDSGRPWCWSQNLRKFAGEPGDTETGASVGGLAETTTGYVAAFNYDEEGGSGNRMVHFYYVAKADGAGGSTKPYQLLDTKTTGSSTPILAPTGLEGGYLMWNGPLNSETSDTLYYMPYDAEPEIVPWQEAQAPLSDCQPIPYGDGVIWYVTDNSIPTFYTLDSNGVTAHSVNMAEPEPEPEPDPTLEPALSDNIYQNDGYIYSQPVYSYLYPNESGLTRVEYIDGAVVIEEYDNDFRLQSSRTLKPELPLWGGFFAGKKYNFLVFGQENPDETDFTEVLRVVKYDKNWKRLGSVSLRGGYTTIPFYAGSLRCAESGDYLYIHTSHRMYAAPDGNHQANMTFAMHQENLAFSTARYMPSMDYAYVSHSFNQFILVDQNDKIVTLDHGDAYPRSAVLSIYNADASSGNFADLNWGTALALQNFPGPVGENYTGAMLGGLAETTNGYVTAFNYDDGRGISTDGDYWEHERYVYFHYVDKSNKTESIQYRLDSPNSCGTPVLAPTGLNGGYLMWNGRNIVGEMVPPLNDTLYYTTYDANGVLKEEWKTFSGAPLSDCQPIPYGDGVIWYVTDGFKTLTFYTLDSNGVTAHPVVKDEPKVDAEKPIITVNPQNATYTVGETAKPLTVAATVTDGGTLSYQWYYYDSRIGDNQAIPGATSASYTPSTQTAGRMIYSCVVTNTNDKATGEKTVWSLSNAVVITVNDIVLGDDAQTPAISKQPVDAIYSVGDTPTPLTVEASVTDGGTLSYQWYSRVSGTWTDKIISGATSSTYTPSTETAGKILYFCKVTNTNDAVPGQKTASITSNAATITTGHKLDDGLTIITNPSEHTIRFEATELWVSAHKGNTVIFAICDGIRMIDSVVLSADSGYSGELEYEDAVTPQSCHAFFLGEDFKPTQERVTYALPTDVLTADGINWKMHLQHVTCIGH